MTRSARLAGEREVAVTRPSVKVGNKPTLAGCGRRCSSSSSRWLLSPSARYPFLRPFSYVFPKHAGAGLTHAAARAHAAISARHVAACAIDAIDPGATTHADTAGHLCLLDAVIAPRPIPGRFTTMRLPAARNTRLPAARLSAVSPARPDAHCGPSSGRVQPRGRMVQRALAALGTADHRATCFVRRAALRQPSQEAPRNAAAAPA